MKPKAELLRTQRKYDSKVMFFDSICYIMEIKRNTRMSWQMRWGILATGNTAGKFASTILAMENERETLAAAGHHSDKRRSSRKKASKGEDYNDKVVRTLSVCFTVRDILKVGDAEYKKFAMRVKL